MTLNEYLKDLERQMDGGLRLKRESQEYLLTSHLRRMSNDSKRKSSGRRVFGVRSSLRMKFPI